MSAPGPTGERQEHLDGMIALGGAGVCFEVLTFSRQSEQIVT